jgi:L-alanine-DL-glutamate epimerase-like enolase superfamily enzyme
MKIARVEHLHADAGDRNFDFLKITTGDGLVGWSEYNESFGGLGVSAVIDGLVPHLIGQDPRAWEAIVTKLYAVRRQAAGGVVQQAIAAIENALLDVTARSLNVPVYALFGGPVRERVRIYWSHCGTYRLARWQAMQIPRVATLEDVVKLGKEVRDKGWTALKTNPMLFRVDTPYQHAPGFARHARDYPELNADRHVLDAVREQLAAFRQGAGPDVDILVDLNFNFKTEGFLKMARAMEPYDLLWVEIDTRDAKALHYIRSRTSIPVASCECLFGRRDYRPYFEAQSVDVAIVDTPWNGVAESIKIANMADTYEVNVAPHNFYGWLATCMSAHFVAAVPNVRIMEIDPDVVPWYDDLVTTRPRIDNGHLVIPSGPGWGTEINEEAVKAHPPRKR